MKARNHHSEEWVSRILNLRKKQGLTQAALASRLHFSAMALSRWENGSHEPSAKAYILLGNLASNLDRLWFWERAGLPAADVSNMLPRSETVRRIRRENRPDLSAVPVVTIPILRATVATPGGKGDSVLNLEALPAEEIIATPESWCPNPSETNCLRVRGDVMKPLINDGDIVAVDCAQTDPSKLNGKIVVTWHQEAGLILSRFLFINGAYLLEAESREFQPWQLSNKRNWRIIGKVLWSIRRAP
jgi:transcriptional regulator with XRE-family HTH domain